jgi:geranylgeranyl diphosphate synthase, type II
LNSQGAPVAIDTSAKLLVATVEALGARAPAIVAAAAKELSDIQLGLHFGDGSHALLAGRHSRLSCMAERPAAPTVEVYFDDRAMNLLFDLEQKPVDQVWVRSLDVRGERESVLATWRCFGLLSQRASGLRAVQALWREYRDRTPERWGQLRAKSPSTNGARQPSGWLAIDYLESRHPADLELVTQGGLPMSSPAHVLWDGRAARGWWEWSKIVDNDLLETMKAFRQRIVEEILAIIPREREPKIDLYDLMREYPVREGKGLRPTLTISSCVALGGRSEEAVRAAAAIELFHDGFLVHDDIADESINRRGQPTLHAAHSIGLAVNAGDGLNLFAVDTVLSNLPTLGLARTLALIHDILHMCRETVEGQALELGWIHRNLVPPNDEDYFVMSTKKTGWYTCITPCRMGAICAGATGPAVLDRFNEAFRHIGIAFQIQDDVLNLIGEEDLYGKESLGDLLEGKRTLMMIHLFRECDQKTRRRMAQINRIPRRRKKQEHADEMLAAMKRFGSIEYAIGVADTLAQEGVRLFEQDLAFIPDNEAKAVLRQIAHYVTTRPL